MLLYIVDYTNEPLGREPNADGRPKAEGLWAESLHPKAEGLSAEGRRPKAGRRPEAEGRRPEAEGRRPAAEGWARGKKCKVHERGVKKSA